MEGTRGTPQQWPRFPIMFYKVGMLVTELNTELLQQNYAMVSYSETPGPTAGNCSNFD